MKRFAQSFVLAVFTMFSLGLTCNAQNGPTQLQVVLNWTQSTTVGVTANCVYRSTGTGSVPAPPAIFCSTAPITTYTDSSVAANTTDVYAVTAKVGQTESGYSNTATAVVPANPNAPSGLQAPTVTENRQNGLGMQANTLQAKVEWRKR